MPTVTGEAYYFLVASNFHYRFRLSVRITIFKLISGFRFHPKCLMLYINGFVSMSSTNKWKAFFKFLISFPIIDWKPKKIKRIGRREYWSKCNVLYINGYVSTSSTNKWKAFFKFLISFRIIDWKPKKKSNEYGGVNIDQSATCYI